MISYMQRSLNEAACMRISGVYQGDVLSFNNTLHIYVQGKLSLYVDVKERDLAESRA